MPAKERILTNVSVKDGIEIEIKWVVTPRKTASIKTELGAIQIIRDTLGGGGSTMCHISFFTFRNTDFKTFGSRTFCLTARLGI
jgi:hypothetical protein